MKIWAWGANSNSQLGFSIKCEQISTPTEVPIQIPCSNDVSSSVTPLKICGGAYQTLLLVETTYGTTYHGAISPHFHILSRPHVLDVSTGWDFNACLVSPSRLVLFGTNITFGQLGTNSEDSEALQITKYMHSVLSPNQFAIFVNPQLSFSAVSAGVRFSVALDSSLKPYFWGDNIKRMFSVQSTEQIIHTPCPLECIPSEQKFSLIRCGKSFILALSLNNNCLYGCGLNKFGVLLSSDKIVSSLSLIWKPCVDDPIVDIQCGWTHALMLTKSGKVFSWGRNNFYQLGRSFEGDFDKTMGQIDIPPVSKIACGSEHNLALTTDNQLFSWGWNEHDNCGVPSVIKECVPLPTKVEFPEACNISVIGCGPGSSFAVSV